jgi:hypothetical protein
MLKYLCPEQRGNKRKRSDGDPTIDTSNKKLRTVIRRRDLLKYNKRQSDADITNDEMEDADHPEADIDYNAGMEDSDMEDGNEQEGSAGNDDFDDHDSEGIAGDDSPSDDEDDTLYTQSLKIINRKTFCNPFNVNFIEDSKETCGKHQINILRDIELIGSHGQTIWHQVGRQETVKG